MKNFLPRAAIALVSIVLASAVSASGQVDTRMADAPPKPIDVRLPNGKLQQDEILKADHEKSVKDAAQLIELSESLKKELEKDDSHVLSISSLKKTEEIEKIAKRIRVRLKH